MGLHHFVQTESHWFWVALGYSVESFAIKVSRDMGQWHEGDVVLRNVCFYFFIFN